MIIVIVEQTLRQLYKLTQFNVEIYFDSELKILNYFIEVFFYNILKCFNRTMILLTFFLNAFYTGQIVNLLG